MYARGIQVSSTVYRKRQTPKPLYPNGFRRPVQVLACWLSAASNSRSTPSVTIWLLWRRLLRDLGADGNQLLLKGIDRDGLFCMWVCVLGGLENRSRFVQPNPPWCHGRQYYSQTLFSFFLFLSLWPLLCVDGGTTLSAIVYLKLLDTAGAALEYQRLLLRPVSGPFDVISRSVCPYFPLLFKSVTHAKVPHCIRQGRNKTIHLLQESKTKKRRYISSRNKRKKSRRDRFPYASFHFNSDDFKSNRLPTTITTFIFITLVRRVIGFDFDMISFRAEWWEERKKKYENEHNKLNQEKKRGINKNTVKDEQQ